jgi:hypothetical protein
MYNGKRAACELVVFDWNIRKDLAAVMLGFGSPGFFYDEMKTSIVQAGAWDFFAEEGKLTP